MTEGAHFTIDFIEEEHRESITTLMDILCIDLKAAYDLFHRSGCNTQAAINLMTSGSPEKHHFEDSVPRNPRGRQRRNQPADDFEEQINYFEADYDFDDGYVDEYGSLPAARRRPPPNRVQQETEFDVKFNKLLELKKKKKTFETKYVIRRQITNGDSRSIAGRIFEKKPKKPTDKRPLDIRPFFKDIQRGLIEKMIPIKFGKGSMSQTLEECYRTFNPLLAFHLNFDMEEKEDTNTIKNAQKKPKNTFKPRKMVIDITDDDHQNQKMIEVDESKKVEENKFKRNEKNLFFAKLLTDKKVERTVNEGFLNYIFNPESYNMESFFKEFFQKSTRKESYLVVLRVNYLEDVEFVAKISLDQILENIKDKDEKGIDIEIANIVDQLKKISSKNKAVQNEEESLMDRYNRFQKGIYHYEYKRPPTTAQKIKINEDREIIKQQEEEFMNMQNEYIEQQIKELEKQGPAKQKVSKEEILQKRKIVREWLTVYKEGDPDIMMVKFRLPSGKNIILHVSTQEKVQYLFDFIFSNEMEDLGFQEEEDGGCTERLFDIIRPEDKLSLETKTDVPLQELFEGSLMEVVIVKQKS